MTLYRPVIEENVPRVAIAVGFVFIMVWFLVLIEMCIIRRTDRVRLILNRVVTISKFYSDTEEEGYFCSKASNFSCKTRYCGLYVPSVVLMGLFLLLGSTAIFLCRYALQGKWYTEDIILFSLASCCSFFTFFLLFPLTDTSVSCCCGLRPVSSKYLHQCGGVSFLCFLPLLNFLVLAYIMFYKLFVSRCIALVSCLFIAFLLGGVIYVKKWCSIKATEDRIGNELEIPLDDVEASKKILANFINDPKNGITLADRDVITQEVNEAVSEAKNDREVKRATSLVKKYAALGGLRDDSSASNEGLVLHSITSPMIENSGVPVDVEKDDIEIHTVELQSQRDALVAVCVNKVGIFHLDSFSLVYAEWALILIIVAVIMGTAYVVLLIELRH